MLTWVGQEWKEYFRRISTALRRSKPLPNASLRHILDSFLGSFIGILVLSYLDDFWWLERSDLVMIVGSFGAQAILIFATPTVPLAQPWNCIFGNFIGATVGVSSYKFFQLVVDDVDDWIWTASAVAVSLAIVIMLLTKSLHPPAGATALIAVQGSQQIHALGYYYVLFPAVVASTIQVLLGVIWNNFSKDPSRSYPTNIIPFHIQIRDVMTVMGIRSPSPEAQNSQGSDQDNYQDSEQEIDQDYLEEIEGELSSSGLELASTVGGPELVSTIEV